MSALNQLITISSNDPDDARRRKLWLFVILHGAAKYGGVPIRQTCDSLQGQGRAVETKLCFGEYRNNAA